MNVAPGTVVDSGLTEHSNGSFDFYMVPHKATIATALPVHYHVVMNTVGINREQVEEFTYHMCYNYFNFMGSIKVPGSVMYAQKLANYAHELRVNPSDALATRLHYL